ncbi:DUF1223 domain-containing protein [Methylobacterium sp. Leaf108]|uniref:DUF1223 domain-containing protein n=1 Tax=Methylobacterium sp. Leaf108 TaxID=1736256 RepID=UPI0006FA50B3|nr:DUF1223 domain-containing protein [Methylobacterium sp. Leaf108]KQP58557.1 hypothetical protein ASF39_18190 [Methylobacterium sp. Leaf108]
MRALHLALAGLTLLSAPLAAAQRPVVVELFTSQSCSSCPPAEAVLTDLRDQPDVLALGFHVTYWNRLSWRDTVSLPAATDRQEAYARTLGETRVFTPQMVIDGRRSVLGSQRGEVAAAIAEARRASPVAAMTLVRKGGDLVVGLGAGAGSGRIVLVGFDREVRTAVARGENAGRDLVQSNVVRSVRDLGGWTGAARTVTQPAPAGSDAAVLLQAADGRILGAARLTGAGS